YDEDPVSLDQQLVWFQDHDRSGHPVFVAEQNSGRVIGWSSLTAFRQRSAYRFTLEDSIYVAADERGAGVGRTLLPPLIQAARELSAHSIIAAIDAGSE